MSWRLDSERSKPRYYRRTLAWIGLVAWCMAGIAFVPILLDELGWFVVGGLIWGIVFMCLRRVVGEPPDQPDRWGY